MEGLQQYIMDQSRKVRTGDRHHPGYVTRATLQRNDVVINQNLFPGYEDKRYQIRVRTSATTMRRHDPRKDLTTA